MNLKYHVTDIEQIIATSTEATVTDDVTSFCSFRRRTSTTLDPDNNYVVINDTGAADIICPSPSSGETIYIDEITIGNKDTIARTLTIYWTNQTLFSLLWSGVLGAGEKIVYTNETGWQKLNANGDPVVMQEQSAIGYDGRTIGFYKTGTAADAVGYWYCTLKDAGYPGAFAIGTPGLNGRVTDGTTTTDNGCIPFQNAATGSIYLKNTSVYSSTSHYHEFFDLLWINSGLVVTTTTAQAITTPTLPARDVNGSTDGEGLTIGLLTTTANTNAAVNNTMTVNYTNSAGTAGRTATLSNNVGDMLPATAVIGNIIWFRLQAGDKGVRSIEGITFATSLGAGAVSLLIARKIQGVPTTVVNVGSYVDNGYGIKLYDGTCLIHNYKASATTATVLGGSLTFIEQD